MTRNETATDEIEIDLLKLAEVLMHRAGIIIVATLLVAAIAFGITFYFITPVYTSSALMYVNNSSFSVGSTSFSISSAELTAAKSLVDTYVVILKSRTTLEDIIRRDGLAYTYEELYGMVDASAVNSTEIFEVNVTSESPAEAERIANTIAEVLPEKISSIVEGSDVRIVDYAVIPSQRTSPSYTMNTVIGALVGFVFSAAIIIMQYLFDESIRSEDYLTQTYPNIPLLAVVPDMMSSKNEKYGGYYGSSSSSSSSGGEKRQRQSTSSQRPASAQRRPAGQRPQTAAAQRQPRPAPAAMGVPSGSDVKKGGEVSNG